LCGRTDGGPLELQCQSIRRWADGTRPPTLHRDDVTGLQPRASTRLHPAIHLHLARLQQLLGVRAVLGEAREFEELADPDRVSGKRDVEDWRAGHFAILPVPEAPDAGGADGDRLGVNGACL
jgi:hypothetical protein